MTRNGKKIVILGSNGALGQALLNYKWPEIYLVIGFPHAELDITQSKTIEDKLDELDPDVLINAAVYGKGEGVYSTKAYMVNALSLYSISHYCKKNNILLFHYSTDYVFDGYQNTPYKEEDNKNPLNVYGNSKYAGELIIESVCPNYYIIRTSWLFGIYGKNFVKWICDASKINQEISVVNDQIGCPTYVGDVAYVTCNLIDSFYNKGSDFVKRVYHYSGKEPITWYEYSLVILREINKHYNSTLRIILISTEEYRKKNFPVISRPLYSVLDCTQLERQCSLFQKSWKIPLKKVIKELVKLCDS